ncbi:CPBP family intramembrane glutamic endopeptidase [Clostridium neuense]|uniref:CPBP family intramembrane glutamic endopeptidase n=1 Tax=Clostridium neuense TaxID=1728934 RepID=A0ABW8TJD6_9CLOT
MELGGKEVNVRNKNTKNSIVLFLIFAFGLPLICVLLEKGVFKSGIINFILFGIEAAAPTLSAIIVTSIFNVKIGIRKFLKKCYIKNIKVNYVLLGVMIPIVLLVAAKLTWCVFASNTTFMKGITVKKLLIIAWSLIAEEIGWRGFLQERLDKPLGYLLAPILLGTIWALWHYHFFWLGTMSAPLILFWLGCIADSFGYYWITKKSKGNIIPVSLWHFTENMFANVLLITPEYNHGSNIPYLLCVVYSCIMAIIISLKLMCEGRQYR